MNKRIIIILIAICIVSMIAVGCTSPTASPGPTATPSPTNRTITDFNGNVVTLPATINHVAVLTSPPVQIMYVLGVQDKLSVLTQQTQKAVILRKMDPRVNTMPAPRAGEINIEELLKGNPDICMGGSTDMANIRNRTSIPAIDVIANNDNSSLYSIQQQVLFMGNVLGADARANAYVDYTNSKIAMLRNRTSQIPQNERLKVYLGSGAAHLNTYGGKSYMQSRYDDAGLINAAVDLVPLSGQYSSGYQEVSLETINQWNPDIIIIDDGMPEDLYNNSQWANINAIKNHRVYRMPTGIFIWSRPTAESATLFPEWLAITAYPNRFSDLNMSNEVRDFYARIFKYNLTDQDLNTLMYPQTSYNAGGKGTGTGSGSGAGNNSKK